MASIHKILIANRGEIAVRVIKTAQRLGYRTVAVFSEADRDALHTHLADESVLIGPASVGESYLKMENIIDAALKTDADAIHPGYGFLSENAGFAQLCATNNILFIGPSAEAITLMGSKRQSKLAMLEADVPCIPGYEGDDQSNNNLITQARAIGTPLMIKASAGGGGRGMRLVNDLDAIEEQLASARSEAQNAFGNGELILEKAIINPRHIEIQVFGDQQGQVIYLGERDCSIQRRHQKVVEEAPSPAVNEELRKSIGEAAVKAAQSCRYVGAGTVEFLLADNNEFYFLEMNTRLQVEHPVTEMITGIDLVEWQIDVAQGKPLPITQDQVELNGHAVEVRLYAEDPGQNFMPQTGPVLAWSPAEAQEVRIDHGIRSGATVTPFYDPMLAKLIAWGKDRRDAIRKLHRLIQDTHLLGVKTNKTFLANLVAHPVFNAGGATTHFIADHFSDDPSLSTTIAPFRIAAVAALVQHHKTHGAWNSGHNLARPARWQSEDTLLEIALKPSDNSGLRFAVTQPGGPLDESESHEIELLSISDHHVVYCYDGIRRHNSFHYSGTDLHIADPTGDWHLIDKLHAAAASTIAAGSGRITAPMDGAIVALLCEAGQKVTKGTTLAVMEAMKMEHPLKADKDGIVRKVSVNEGEQVKGRQLLVEIGD